MPEFFVTIIERDAYNSILYMVLGGLFLLSCYHLSLYFQNKDRSYLLYSFYTFCSFIAYTPVIEGGILKTFSIETGIGEYTKVFFTVAFNCIYFFFFAAFLNIKKLNPRWYKIIMIPPLVLLGISILLTVVFLISGNNMLYSFKNYFIVLITVHTIVCFYLLLKIKNNLKYYILFGGIVLFICSVIGIHQIRQLPGINISRKMGDFTYFAGLFIENLAFSLALGHKQKITNEEKITYHKDLVSELKKNEELRENVHRENEKRLTIQEQQIKYLQEITDLKLAVLQSQMNPHFIFNALNSIKYCILEQETEKAVNYLTKFSKIMRTILVASKMKEFTLSQEVHTLQLYVDIENLRFTDIIFDINIQPDINPEDIKLPPLVLQPFIENAILHGIATVDHKNITLDISRKNSQIHIVITDSGVGREKAAAIKSLGNNPAKSFGVDIACEMLTNYFAPKKFTIEYKDLHEYGMPSGTCVTITIPNMTSHGVLTEDSPKKSLYSQT